MYDTVKGGDYLVDQDAAEVLAREAIDAVSNWSTWACRSTARPKGRSTSAALAGTPQFRRGGRSARACYAADRTGSHDPADALPAVHQEQGHTSSTSSTCSTC